MSPQKITITDLIDQFDVLLFDAYGVIVDAGGAIAHARELVNHLHAIRKPYVIVTNGSMGNTSFTAQSYQAKGLPIPESNIISSGSLLADWVKTHSLTGAKAYVVGPETSQELGRESGLRVTRTLDIHDPVQAIILANQTKENFLDECEDLLSFISQCHLKQIPLKLLLPNPDLIYPKNADSFGYTSGALSLLIETALKGRFAHQAPTFERLGKPFAPIFDAAKKRFPGKSLVMIGDQIETDIIGAKQAGIPTVLILSGISKGFSEVEPDYILNDLMLS